MNSGRKLIRAAAIVDGAGLLAAPGAILLEGDRIVAAGAPAAIGVAGDCTVVHCERSVVLPGLVNAHAHLDLTHLGPRAFEGEFSQWVEGVRAARHLDDEAIADSVRRGAELARAGGTALIGDIAGARSLAAIEALRESGLPGVSFLEVFGIGRRQESAVAMLKAALAEEPHFERGVLAGVQPHALYSCGMDVYRAAAETNRPLATHLAETQEEIEFVHRATGPIADMLRKFGAWDDSITGFGAHSVDVLGAVLAAHPWVAAHVNYVDVRHLEMMSGWPITVAYCPRASAYFGHANHRYRQMLDAGINVALGTDSLVCLDTPGRISVWDEMRLLHHRDGTDSLTLLRMATTNGARALGFDPRLVSLARGRIAGLLEVPLGATVDLEADALDLFERAISGADGPKWLAGPFSADEAWLASIT